MTEIEWQETRAFQPEPGSLPDFCRECGYPTTELPEGDGLLVFVERRALESLEDFLRHDLLREHGGVLVGKVYADQKSGRPYQVIQAAIPALDTEGSAVHLQFTPAAWAYISGIIDENYPHLLVTGWYHSHPGLGVFMSETDRATQQAFFHHPWNVAVVSDPAALETGWFAGAGCQPLKAGQVIVFDAGGEAVRTETAEPAVPGGEPGRRREVAGGGWLLPFSLLPLGLLLLGLFALARRWGRSRTAADGGLR